MDADANLLSSLTRLVTSWASTGTQAQAARQAGVAINPSDIPPVYVLGLQGPMRASALADALRVTRPTMSKQLDRLDREGLIVRSSDAEDGRATVISLSPAGTESHRRLVERGRQMVREALAGWGDAEAASFTTQLERFVSALGVHETGMRTRQ